MKSYFRIVIRQITLLISYLIPIDKRLLVFVSYPDFGDNSYALFRYIIKNNIYKHYKFCWLVGDYSCKIELLNKVRSWGICEEDIDLKITKRKSLKGIFYCYRAKNIFNTVGIFVDIVFRQKNKRINMWHGMPIKKIFSDVPNGDITIATSFYFKPLMADGLKIPENNVMVIGQPRNDLLFHGDEVNDDINGRISDYHSIGIWMPTFRRSTIDQQYNDGEYSMDKIAFVPIEDLKHLDDFLKSINTLLIIKFHPMDVLQKRKYAQYSNIIILKNETFKQNELYPLLGKCDFLISDYSSVVIDFEILGRPIGITTNDIAKYKSSRGLNMDTIPGFVIEDYDSLINFINEAGNGKLSLADYGNKYNLYRDDNSSQRLLTELNLI